MKVGYFQYKHKSHKFVLNDKIITETIYYGEEEGLVIASRYSLKLLSQQVVFSMDTTFNITKYKNLKLITVVFLNSNRKIVLGCVGLLPGGESAGNISAFISSLKVAVSKVSTKPFSKLKYIITDDSQASHNTLKDQFSGVEILKCVWHKKNNLIDNLDYVGVNMMTEAMWDKNPITYIARIEALALYYSFLFKLTEKNKFVNTKFKYNKYILKNKKSLLGRKEIVERKNKYTRSIKRMENYVRKAKEDCSTRCIAFRCILPERYQGNELNTTIIDAIKENCARILKEVCAEAELDIPKQREAQIIYQSIVMQLKDRPISGITLDEMDTEVQKLKSEFENAYLAMNVHDGITQTGLKMLTTSNNESIHNALKNHYKIKHSPTLIQLFLKLQKYFISKFALTVKRITASKLTYKFYMKMNARQLKN